MMPMIRVTAYRACAAEHSSLYYGAWAWLYEQILDFYYDRCVRLCFVSWRPLFLVTLALLTVVVPVLITLNVRVIRRLGEQLKDSISLWFHMAEIYSDAAACLLTLLGFFDFPGGILKYQLPRGGFRPLYYVGGIDKNFLRTILNTVLVFSHLANLSMTLDRFAGVALPVLYNNHATLPRAKKLTLCFLLFAALFSLPLFGLQFYFSLRYSKLSELQFVLGPERDLRWYASRANIVFLAGLALIFTAELLAAVGLAIGFARYILHREPNSSNAADGGHQLIFQKTVLVLSTVLLNIICALPSIWGQYFTLANYLRLPFRISYKYQDTFYAVELFATGLNAGLIVLLHILLTKTYRKAARELIPNLRFCRNPDQVQEISLSQHPTAGTNSHLIPNP